MNDRVDKVVDFSIRVFIVALAIFCMSFALLIPANRVLDNVNSTLSRADDLMRRINRLAKEIEVAMDDPISDIRLRVHGMADNPELFYQIALLKEKRGDLVGAIREMSMAVGLVAPDAEKYKAKLMELKTREQTGE